MKPLSTNDLFPNEFLLCESPLQSTTSASMSHKENKLLRDERRKVKALEKELARKDKALAETAALLVLREKFNALWEINEED
ncbi:hypothetical protein HJA72_004326 [Vibrio fluvialis]|nr:hypothetical protein [Vibrio fluvialis]